jgi:CelD/BcsL family acetyltransferase involved in cellulose biosynthesis
MLLEREKELIGNDVLPFRISVITDDLSLSQIENEWRSFTKKTPPYSPVHTYDYAYTASKYIPKNSNLNIIVIRDSSDCIVCIWPLYKYKSKGIMISTHLGDGSNQEASGPLINDQEGELNIAHLAIQAATKNTDVLMIFNFNKESAFFLALQSNKYLKVSGEVSFLICKINKFDNYESWVNKKSSSFRKGLRYDRRRLAGLGKLSSIIAPDDESAREIVTWLYETKTNWRIDKGIHSGPPLGVEQIEFFSDLMDFNKSTSDENTKVLAFCLKLDDRIVAACICFVTNKEMLYYMTAFDEEYFIYSPGNLLIEDCVKWCVSKNINFNLGIGEAKYKSRWGDTESGYISYKIAVNWKGYPELLKMVFRLRKAYLRKKYGQKIKRIIKNLKSMIGRS